MAGGRECTETEMTTSGCKNSQHSLSRNKVIYTLKSEKHSEFFMKRGGAPSEQKQASTRPIYMKGGGI